MFSISDIQKNSRNEYSGVCPRCDHKSRFITLHEEDLDDDVRGVRDTFTIALLKCGCGNCFFLQTGLHNFGDGSVYVAPDTRDVDIQNWVPTELNENYLEFKKAIKLKMYKSAVALGSILIESIINQKVDSKLRGLELGKKIENLVQSGKIDVDQLSSATIARLSRNKVLHPKKTELTLEAIEMSEIDFFYRT